MPNQESKKSYKFFAPKVFIRTFGCQMNDRDSEALAGLLQDKGFVMVNSEKEADVILFNTCSVRQHAEDKVWSELGRISKMSPLDLSQKARQIKAGGTTSPKVKKKIIGLVGCMAQNYKQEIFKRAPSVDLVVGPNDLLSIPNLIKEIVKEKSKSLAVSTMERQQDFYVSNFRWEKDHAYVVISEGCSNFCSYCVVPYVRGRLHCRAPEDIINEIKKTIDLGIKNITLLGQNVNSYRFNSCDFVKLLEMVNKIKDLKEFDFVTSHPKDTPDELFFAMRDLKKCKKSLHLPVQSGSDRILKLMNRGYDRAHYLNLIEKYRKIVGGGFLSTDIIAGFPTETKKDFQSTLKLLKQIEFDFAYIFKYSPRPHTKAEDLIDDVPQKEKERRHKILLDLQKDISKSKKSKPR